MDLDIRDLLMQNVVDNAKRAAEATDFVQGAKDVEDVNGSSIFNEKNNISSMTVNVDGSNGDSKSANGADEEGKVKVDEGTTVQDLIDGQYGKDKDGNDVPLTEDEQKSIAQAMFDNNREAMIDSINDSYLTSQVLADLGIDADGENLDKALELVGLLTADPVDQAAVDALGFDKSKVTSIQNKLAADRNSEDGYKAFDVNTKADEIPAEYILYSSFDEDTDVFCPEINTLDADSVKGTNVTTNIGFESQDQSISIDISDIDKASMTEEEYKEAVKARITEAIAKNYSSGDGTDSLGDLNNLAGMNILSAIGLDNGNNALFDKQQEDPSAYLDLLVEAAIADPSKPLDLACPDTEMSLISKDKMTDEEARAYVLDPKNVEGAKITYMHTSQPAVSMSELYDKINEGKADDEKRDVVAEDLLDFVNYGKDDEGNDISLKDALDSAKEKLDGITNQNSKEYKEALAEYERLQAVGRTALEQIFANNTELNNLLNEQGKSNADVLNINLTSFYNELADGDTAKDFVVDLENIKYIGKEEAPKESAPIVPPPSNNTPTVPKETTVSVPVETTVSVPVETTVSVPVETTVSVPVETTVSVPVETTVSVPVETTVTVPVETTVTVPGRPTPPHVITVPQETTVTVPVETTVSVPVETTVSVPVETTVSVPVETTVSVPVETTVTVHDTVTCQPLPDVSKTETTTITEPDPTDITGSKVTLPDEEETPQPNAPSTSEENTVTDTGSTPEVPETPTIPETGSVTDTGSTPEVPETPNCQTPPNVDKTPGGINEEDPTGSPEGGNNQGETPNEGNPDGNPQEGNQEETPPAENPPAENPPAENPPAENPPAENPPAENPPAENPPAENPPAENPANAAPAETPASAPVETHDINTGETGAYIPLEEQQ